MTLFTLYRNNPNIFFFIWNYDCPEYFNALIKLPMWMGLICTCGGANIEFWWVTTGEALAGLRGTEYPYARPIRAALFAPTHSLLFLLARIEESFLGFWYMPSFALHNQYTRWAEDHGLPNPCADIPETHRESPNWMWPSFLVSCSQVGGKEHNSPSSRDEHCPSSSLLSMPKFHLFRQNRDLNCGGSYRAVRIGKAR